MGIPTFGEGGGGPSRLGKNPNFYQKFVLEASLNQHEKNVFIRMMIFNDERVEVSFLAVAPGVGD